MRWYKLSIRNFFLHRNQLILLRHRLVCTLTCSLIRVWNVSEKSVCVTGRLFHRWLLSFYLVASVALSLPFFSPELSVCVCGRKMGGQIRSSCFGQTFSLCCVSVAGTVRLGSEFSSLSLPFWTTYPAQISARGPYSVGRKVHPRIRYWSDGNCLPFWTTYPAQISARGPYSVGRKVHPRIRYWSDGNWSVSFKKSWNRQVNKRKLSLTFSERSRTYFLGPRYFMSSLWQGYTLYHSDVSS